VRKSGLCSIAAIVLLTLSIFGHAAAADQEVLPEPQPTLTKPDTGEAPLLLSVALYVTNISAIDEADEYFTIDGYLYMSWRDERLALDPGDSAHMRHFKEGDIWMPPMELANAIKYDRYSYTLKVDPNGVVQYMERFDANLSEAYQLREFPFDRQVLNVVLEPFLDRKFSLIFASEDLGSGVSREAYAGLAPWLVQDLYYVPGIVAAYGIVPQIPQARFALVVTRYSGFYIWKVFLPMIVMTMIPWSVFWVDTKEFDWQMKIPIAVMLALVAFEFAVSRDLPRVPYVTFLDAVFLTCFMFVFVCIVEIVAVHAMVRWNMRRLADMIHWHARWAVPVAFVLMLVLLIPIFFHAAPELLFTT
jgi:hypothetical protein